MLLNILSFSESWLNSNNTDESITLLNFHTPFRSDRGPYKIGGGVVVYTRDNINVTRRSDLEMDNLEAVWLQLKLQGKYVLFGTYFNPPNSKQEIWLKLENTFDIGINDNSVDYIMTTGDFKEN